MLDGLVSTHPSHCGLADKCEKINENQNDPGFPPKFKSYRVRSRESLYLVAEEHVLEEEPDGHVEMCFGLFAPLHDLQTLLGVQSLDQLFGDVPVGHLAQNVLQLGSPDVNLKDGTCSIVGTT